MKNRILIVVYAFVAAFFLSVDVVLWVKFNPHDFASISAAIIFGVFGLSAAFLSVKCYKKEINDKL